MMEPRSIWNCAAEVMVSPMYIMVVAWGGSGRRAHRHVAEGGREEEEERGALALGGGVHAAAQPVEDVGHHAHRLTQHHHVGLHAKGGFK